jgi:hypothetical protein
MWGSLLQTNTKYEQIVPKSLHSCYKTNSLQHMDKSKHNMQRELTIYYLWTFHFARDSCCDCSLFTSVCIIGIRQSSSLKNSPSNTGCDWCANHTLLPTISETRCWVNHVDQKSRSSQHKQRHRITECPVEKHKYQLRSRNSRFSSQILKTPALEL